MAEDEAAPGVGRGRPPSATRFAKGVSGNPKGRPPESRNKGAPYERVLGRMVTVRIDGVERRLSAAEAFLLHLTRRGLAGDASAARAMMDAIEAAPERQAAERPFDLAAVLMRSREMKHDSGAESAACWFGMAVKLDRYRDTARNVLQRWLVELALARLAERRLTLEEQQTVWKGSRTPWKIRWPEWWEWRG